MSPIGFDITNIRPNTTTFRKIFQVRIMEELARKNGGISIVLLVTHKGISEHFPKLNRLCLIGSIASI